MTNCAGMYNNSNNNNNMWQKYEIIVITLKWLNIQLRCKPSNEIIVQK